MGRGIYTRGDIEPTTIDGIGLNSIYREYQSVLETWNKSRDAFTRLFTFDTVAPGDAIAGDGDRMAFEVQSQFGVPKAGHVTPSQFLVGYPHTWYDVATRFTRQFLRDSRREQVDAVHTAALEAHNDRLFTLAIKALLVKTTIATRPANENGTPVFDLYDGESDSLPPSFGGVTFAAGHQHYLTTNSATLDGADLRDMINHITHHGYGVGASERVVILVNPSQADTVRGFRVSGGEPFDFIPSSSAAPYLTDLRIAGGEPPAEFEGLTVIGSYGKALIIENVLVPTGYVVALATSGAGSRRNPLAFRQHETQSERGLKLIPGPTSYLLQESFYQFGAGFGVRNRGAAVVMQITVGTSYTSPTIATRV